MSGYSKDYYELLQIKRNANLDEINSAFRRMALQYHPSKSQADTKLQFNDVAEAFAVLSDEKLRAIFDQYGEATLKLGAIDEKGARLGGWTFSQDPEDIFNAFFGSSNPYAEYYNKGPKLGYDNGHRKPQKEPPIVVNLHCSLEELYSGCKKRVSVSKKILTENGLETLETVKTIEVGAGWKEGTKITFRKEGNEHPQNETGDLVFMLKHLPHPCFERKGSNLRYTAKISLVQALTGCIVDIKLLDGKTHSITIEQVVNPCSTIKIPGMGMPKAKDTSKFGDLIIGFDVTYPVSLTESQKLVIRETL
mmetsp:Transcript_30937/g.54258  ORF Transcript_30937/g.54258 Transcript_30937/m.54258 type:complete len:307 (-) Transcript_30937:197-1117(-)|eukprot:CAMPEP_0197528424 /NCGR_PEP_ID=MMETSP1318-20131121/25052_1 /TAXON_ID=552666 /ORGANISM="Partenskyella glossopodia, Strain RCC365" /LENGTH=306 /DNA_ID=CAMNT_0043083527 /DNA_START=145 /DNA_END=1065 /DNA_ORIENTATION=+